MIDPVFARNPQEADGSPETRSPSLAAEVVGARSPLWPQEPASVGLLSLTLMCLLLRMSGGTCSPATMWVNPKS